MPVPVTPPRNDEGSDSDSDYEIIPNLVPLPPVQRAMVFTPYQKRNYVGRNLVACCASSVDTIKEILIQNVPYIRRREATSDLSCLQFLQNVFLDVIGFRIPDEFINFFYDLVRFFVNRRANHPRHFEIPN